MNVIFFKEKCFYMWNRFVLLCQPDNLKKRLRLETPLIQSILKKEPIAFYNLIKQGVDINQSGLYGRTPLMVLCENLTDPIVYSMFKYIMRQKPDIEKRDSVGKTALVFAAHKNQTEAVKVLISHGADVNALDKGNASSLSYAVFHQNEKMINVLLAADADPLKGDLGLVSPYEMALAYRNKRILSELDKHLSKISEKETNKKLISDGKQSKVSAFFYRYDNLIKGSIMATAFLTIGSIGIYGISTQEKKSQKDIQPGVPLQIQKQPPKMPVIYQNQKTL